MAEWQSADSETTLNYAIVATKVRNLTERKSSRSRSFVCVCVLLWSRSTVNWNWSNKGNAFLLGFPGPSSWKKKKSWKWKSPACLSRVASGASPRRNEVNEGALSRCLTAGRSRVLNQPGRSPTIVRYDANRVTWFPLPNRRHAAQRITSRTDENVNQRAASRRRSNKKPQRLLPATLVSLQVLYLRCVAKLVIQNARLATRKSRNQCFITLVGPMRLSIALFFPRVAALVFSDEDCLTQRAHYRSIYLRRQARPQKNESTDILQWKGGTIPFLIIK